MKENEMEKMLVRTQSIKKTEPLMTHESLDKIKKNTIASNFLQKIMGNRMNMFTSSADNGKSNIKASRNSIRFRKGVKAVMNLIRIQEYKNILGGSFQKFIKYL